MKKFFKILKLKFMLFSVNVRADMVYEELITGTLPSDEVMAELDDLYRIEKILKRALSITKKS